MIRIYFDSMLSDHSWWVQGTICGAGNRTRVGHMQGKYSNPYTISPKLSFKLLNVEVIR